MTECYVVSFLAYELICICSLWHFVIGPLNAVFNLCLRMEFGDIVGFSALILLVGHS